MEPQKPVRDPCPQLSPGVSQADFAEHQRVRTWQSARS